jgi:hypothetical protein
VDSIAHLGAPWKEVFRRRDLIARQWYARWGGAVPLEELLSYGNLVITRALARYETTTSTIPFLTVVTMDLNRKLPDVWYQWFAGRSSRQGCHLAGGSPAVSNAHADT